jgi:transposase
MERTATHVILTIAEFDTLLERIGQLENRIKELESQINKNSSNSSKPPSSDGYKKGIKNNREPSQNKPGAQDGHQGSTLQMVKTPDKIIQHKVQGTCACGQDLTTLSVVSIQRKQEFELPEKLIEVIEHQIEVKQCTCGKTHRAACEIKGITEYGKRFKALMVYLNQYQFLPFERLQEFCEDCLGQSISDGVLESSNQKCYNQLEQTEEIIKQELIKSAVIHNDETGIRCEGKTQWIHSTSTPALTHYSIQNKRGQQAMDAIGILPNYQHTSVHDRWASYENYPCKHSYCNAHLLRELKYLYEELNHKWALEMKKLLMQAHDYKKQNKLSSTTIQAIEKKYVQIVHDGFKQEPKPKIPDKPKRGRTPQSKSKRLLDVFANQSEKVLRFMFDKDVPFDNNLAERDLRMVKLKQKISGCFRSKNGAQVYCRIRSYISSTRKQGFLILDALQNALIGNPVSLLQPEQ